MKYEFKGDLGPWRIAAQNKKTCYYVITAIDYSSSTHRELQILTIHGGAHPIKDHLDSKEANAHLISAAPELLQICIDCLLDYSPTDMRYDQIEQAIQKALNIK